MRVKISSRPRRAVPRREAEKGSIGRRLGGHHVGVHGLLPLRRMAIAKRVCAGVSTVTPKCATSPAKTGSQRPGRSLRCARLRHVCSIATPAMLTRVKVSTNPSESA